MIREHIEQAEALAGKANAREKQLTLAARQWLEGDWDLAGLTWDQVLIEYPRDAMTLQLGHLTDFYRDESFNLRDRVSRIMTRWDRIVSLWARKTELENGYYAFNDMHALIAFVAAGRFDEANEVMAAVEAAAQSNPEVTQMMARDVSIATCRAMIDFGQQATPKPSIGYCRFAPSRTASAAVMHNTFSPLSQRFAARLTA